VCSAVARTLKLRAPRCESNHRVHMPAGVNTVASFARRGVMAAGNWHAVHSTPRFEQTPEQGSLEFWLRPEHTGREFLLPPSGENLNP